jgi:hypothetical protein
MISKEGNNGCMSALAHCTNRFEEKSVLKGTVVLNSALYLAKNSVNKC